MKLLSQVQVCSGLAKVFEALVNDQSKQFLSDNNIFNDSHSGFRSGHGTIITAMLVTNDISSLDFVDHELLQRLNAISLIKISELFQIYSKQLSVSVTECYSICQAHVLYSKQKCSSRIYFGPYLIIYFHKS